MSQIYKVKNWDSIYETAETRKYKNLKWIPTPNKHEGKGYGRLVRNPRKVDLFCAWNLIIQTASKMPTRGVLQDDDGPLSPQDMDYKTGFPEDIFKVAYEFFTEIGWLECIETGKNSQISLDLPESNEVPGESPGISRTCGTEQNRIEQNRTELNNTRNTNNKPAVPAKPLIKQKKKNSPETWTVMHGQKIPFNYRQLLINKLGDELAQRALFRAFYARDKAGKPIKNIAGWIAAGHKAGYINNSVQQEFEAGIFNNWIQNVWLRKPSGKNSLKKIGDFIHNVTVGN